MLPLNPGTESLQPFRIMDLPRELRDQIYRELLLPDKTRIDYRTRATANETGSPYSLQPAILGACKQVHEEAWKILYKETNWILMTVELGEDNDGISKLLRLFGEWVSMRGLEYFPGTPVLRVAVWLGISSHSGAKTMILITQQDIHLFCISFPWVLCYEVSLDFVEEAIQSQHTGDILLDCCREMRGVEKITMRQIPPSAVDAELLVQMRKPIRHIEEFSKRAETYNERGSRQLALRHFLDAADIYYVGWTILQTSFLSGQIEGLNGVDLESVANLKDKMIALLTDYAKCCMRAGIPYKARDWLQQVLFYSFETGLTSQHYGSIYYHKALTFLAERDDYNAIKDLHAVLLYEAGHRDADEQVDAIEVRLQTMPHAERGRIEKYLKEAIEPYRHRKLGDAGLSGSGMHHNSIYYHKALALIAERDDYNAIKELHAFLLLEPGHAGANQQVDAIEVRLQTMPQAKRDKIEEYLEDIIKPYRHRKPRGTEVPGSEIPHP